MQIVRRGSARDVFRVQAAFCFLEPTSSRSAATRECHTRHCGETVGDTKHSNSDSLTTINTGTAKPMNETLRFKYQWMALATLGIAFTAPVVAVASATTPAAPNCNAAEYRQLDFWIGDWNTFETDARGGPSVARVRVEPIAQGCAVHELYEQVDGLIGDSILSYDPVRKQWQQTWVTNRGSIMVLWGNFRNGALVLEGEAHLQDGKSVMQRITWKTQDKGVRESAVLSKDAGKTWTPAFDVLFLKRASERE